MGTLLPPPLKIVICASDRFRQGDEFIGAIRRAFNGAREDASYLASGEDLGVDTLPFTDEPYDTAAAHLDSALHTLVIVLANSGLARNAKYVKWLDDCWQRIQDSDGRHRMLIFGEDESTVDAFIKKKSRLPNAQFFQSQLLGERAVRAAHLGIIALNQASRLLQPFLDSEYSGKQQLFISHAKNDGLPFALAIREQLDRIPGYEFFYDAIDLRFTDNWRRALERGIASSVVVVVRTDEFEKRPACQSEVRWADEYGCPIVVVDARNRLSRPQSVLPLGDAPSVRVPDGNVLRVLYVAAREGLRSMMLSRTIREIRKERMLTGKIEVIHRTPSVACIRRACRDLQRLPLAPAPYYIVYPDPPLSEESLQAMHAVANYYLDGTQLVTPQTLSVMG